MAYEYKPVSLDCRKLNRPVKLIAIYKEIPAARKMSCGLKFLGVKPIGCWHEEDCEFRDPDGNCPLIAEIPT